MANSNTQGFGLIPLGTLGSGYSNQGQSKYVVIAGYSDSDLFQGCTVRIVAGYVQQASSSRVYLCCGVFNGIFYNAATTLKPTWSNWYNQPITPANSENLTAFVLDNPHQLYVGSMSAIMTNGQVDFGETISFSAADPTGSEISGQCSNTLDYANLSVNAGQWRIIRKAEDPSNNDITAAFASVVVVNNLNQFTLGTATVGITWAS